MKDEYGTLSMDEAMAVIQREAPVIVKTETVDTRPEGGKIRYNFAGFNTVWAAVATLMDDLGLIWTAWTDVIELSQGQSRFVLKYSLVHIPTGQSRNGMYPLAGDTPQKIGSAITYARRYALVALLNLRVANDDDDAAATEEQAQLSPSEQAKAGRTPRKPAQRAPARPREAPAPTVEASRAPDPNGPMTERQRGKFFATLGEAGYAERESIKAYVNAVRLHADPELAPVESTRELTYAEAGWVIDAAAKGWKPPEEEGKG